MHFKPARMFLTRGMGRHKEQLTSFELALRAAGIAAFNLVSVSNIFPPECKLIPRHRGLQDLQIGEVVYCVLSRNTTNEPNRLIGSSIGVAIPKDNSRYGYLSEHHSFGIKQKAAGDYAEDLAATMLASTFGIEYPMILIQSGLIDLLTDDELYAVIAHEITHIKCHHVLYHMLADFLVNASSLLGLVGGFIIPLNLALLEWSRKAELSADRGALIVTNNKDASIKLLMKL